MPQGEPEFAATSANDLPAEFQPKQEPPAASAVERIDEQFKLGRQLLMMRVFALMFGSLLLTAAVAWLVGEAAELPDNFEVRQIHVQILFFCELGSVIYLARVVPRLNTVTAGTVLAAFAAFNGVSFAVFSPYLPAHAVAYGFLLTALAFAAMWLYAYRTRLRLNSVRAWATMMCLGLGLIVAGAIFPHTTIAHAGAAFLGVVFFANLVAYHAEDIEEMYLEFEDDANGWKAAFCGALLVYLDFVNLYVLVVSVLARARNFVEREE
jgi:FtsH-binding integral membrane protein